VHRTEDNLKTHTSYLVFAILPREWSEDDEQKCREKWPSAQTGADATAAPQSKRQMKQEARAKRQQEEQEAPEQSQQGTDAKDE
jgi:tRNA (adenine57-N1/adenine58-N1)-methyltransferase